MKQAAIILALLFAAVSIARSDGIYNPPSGGGVTPPPPPPTGCSSPTAPNGVVDLSQCSNAFYAAVIF